MLDIDCFAVHFLDEKFVWLSCSAGFFEHLRDDSHLHFADASCVGGAYSHTLHARNAFVCVHLLGVVDVDGTNGAFSGAQTALVAPTVSGGLRTFYRQSVWTITGDSRRGIVA